jgi:putative hydrolase of the HAD superfamily
MIFFDIDGTLIDHASASAAASLSFYDHFRGAIPFSREEFPIRYEEILNKHFDRFCRGEISIWEQRRERMRDVFAAPELTDSEADSHYRVFIRDYESRTSAFADMPGATRWPAARNYFQRSTRAADRQTATFGTA